MAFFSSGSKVNPSWFALDDSRGYESLESKFFMRCTVFVSEALIYVPAVWAFSSTCQNRLEKVKREKLRGEL